MEKRVENSDCFFARMGQDCHQLLKVTRLHINISQSSLPISERSSCLGKLELGFCLHLLAQQGALTKLPLTLCPTLALNSHLKSCIASD